MVVQNKDLYCLILHCSSAILPVNKGNGYTEVVVAGKLFKLDQVKRRLHEPHDMQVKIHFLNIYLLHVYLMFFQCVYFCFQTIISWTISLPPGQVPPRKTNAYQEIPVPLEQLSQLHVACRTITPHPENYPSPSRTTHVHVHCTCIPGWRGGGRRRVKTLGLRGPCALDPVQCRASMSY